MEPAVPGPSGPTKPEPIPVRKLILPTPKSCTCTRSPAVTLTKGGISSTTASGGTLEGRVKGGKGSGSGGITTSVRPARKIAAPPLISKVVVASSNSGMVKLVLFNKGASLISFRLTVRVAVSVNVPSLTSTLKAKLGLASKSNTLASATVTCPVAASMAKPPKSLPLIML